MADAEVRRPGRRRSRLLLAAIVFDVGALVGLVLAAIGGYLGFEPGFAFAAIGTLLGILALPGTVLSAIVVMRVLRRRRYGLPIGIAVIAVTGVCALLIGPVTLIWAYGLTPNPAADRLRPLEQQIRAEGGTQICDNGDPGLGPDNVQPWKSVYYRMPASDAAYARIKARAQSEGLTPGDDYLHGGLELSETRGRVSLLCSTGTYGQTYTPPAGDMVVSVQLSLPARS